MGIARLAFLCLFLLFFIGPDPEATATPQSQSEILIASIQVSGQKRFSSDQIVAASGLRIGQPFQRNTLDDAVNRLGDTGAFEFARYNFHPQAGKVVVELVVQEAAKFHKCVFDNFVWFSDKELQERVRQGVPLYDGWLPETGNMADAVGAALEKLLREKSIPAPVTHTVYGALGDKNWIYLFDADGAKEQVVTVNFEGAATGDFATLQKEAVPLLKRNYALTEFRIFARTTFIPFYRERGYLQVKLSDPTAKPAKGEECLADCDVAVTFPIAEGLIYQWNPAVWSGDLVTTVSNLEKIMGMKQGELANGKKIDSGLDSVRKEYWSKGYIEAQIKPDATFDDAAKTVTYAVAISQGPQYHMGELQLLGMSPALTGKLKTLWRCKTGDIYDGNYLEEFTRQEFGKALRDTQTRATKIETRPAINKESRIVDVLIEVK